jgi:hypothetical protein
MPNDAKLGLIVGVGVVIVVSVIFFRNGPSPDAAAAAAVNTTKNTPAVNRPVNANPTTLHRE